MKSMNVHTVDEISSKSILPYAVITFGLAWGILALYIGLPEQMSSLFGQLHGNHPLFFLAVWAPAIAAIAIIWRRAGIDGVRRYFRRLLIWRAPWYWYAFLFVGLPLVFYGGAMINGNLATEPFPLASVSAILPALLLSAIKGPVEEMGWRGFLQPLLQRRFSPIWAALIIGVVWGFWHLPAFLLSGTQQSSWSFAPFFAGTIAISVIMASLFNRTGGSVLLAAFMHFQLMNPIWPDAQPYDTYILIVVAVVVIVLDRKSMLSRDSAVDDVILRDHSTTMSGEDTNDRRTIITR